MVDLGGSGGGVIAPSTQQYCLKWNNHQNNLLRMFQRQLCTEQFSDVIIAAEGKSLRCHKMVLSACSTYFESLFSLYTEPNQIIILKDTPYQDIVAIVQFMYKGEINVSQGSLSSLLNTAENLKVKGLAEVSGDDKEKKAAATANSIHSNNNYATSNGLGLNYSSSGPTVTAPRTVPRLAPPPMQMMGRSGLLADQLVNGDSKRKRGRPRTLDGPEDTEPSFKYYTPGTGLVNLSREGSVSPFKNKILGVNPNHAMSPLQAALNRPLSEERHASASPPVSTPSSPLATPIKQEYGEPTPGTPTSMGDFINPLTLDKVASWGVVKMNEYLVTGTRQQYWEENFVKNVMESVRSKELDMKGAADLLGVSYGTLYGRYRENYGYLKHAWNLTGRPQKKNNLWTDPNTKTILDSLKTGNIDIKQAAEALGMDAAMLAFQLAGKGAEDQGSEGDEEDKDEDYHMQELVEVQPEIIVGESAKNQDTEAFDSIAEEEAE